MPALSAPAAAPLLPGATTTSSCATARAQLPPHLPVRRLWSKEQVVVVTGEKSQIYRSESPTSTHKDPSSIPNVHNKFQKLTRTVSKAYASSWIRAWGSVVRNLTQLYPISQLPERETSLLLRAMSLLRPVVGVAVAHVGGSCAMYDGSTATFATLR